MSNYIKKVIVCVWEKLYLKGAFPNLQKKAVIFMLHRMSSPDVIEEGHSVEFLDQAISHLVQKGYNLVSLEDIYKNINEGDPPLEKAIAFTLDDGFIDQAEIAAPVFIKYKCPATIFLITGFVGGGPPPWDFLLKFVFHNTRKKQIIVDLHSETIIYDIDTPEIKYKSMVEFRSWCKKLSDVELEDAMLSLLVNVESEVTDLLKLRAVSLSWDDARELEKSGISFGPHTVSHAILSRCSDDHARKEIIGSWNELKQQLEKPCPVFAYPTGRKEDFSIRDINFIKEAGLSGAVTAEPGCVEFNDIAEADKYLIKRMSFPSNLEDLIQYSSGFECVKESIRIFMLGLKQKTKSRILSDVAVVAKYYIGMFNQYEVIDWSRVARLVFVCKGNICRSPYAEMRAKINGFDAVSIGVFTRKGSRANEDAIRNALYREIDLNDHKARVYDSIDIRDTDLVICMEPWHIRKFREVDNSNCQVTLLGLWCSPKKAILGDPYGQSDEVFLNCFKDIDMALSNIRSLVRV